MKKIFSFGLFAAATMLIAFLSCKPTNAVKKVTDVKQEGGRSHHGGHDLPARGCRGLDGPGELRLIAQGLHQGDGERPRRHGIRHGGARHGALKGRR